MSDKSLDKIETRIDQIEEITDKISIMCAEIRDLIEKHREHDDGIEDEFDDDLDEDFEEDDIDGEEDK
tara:strand:+ start:873 stop:1076 length:204 start_codon:yes stop_codon:yes gene_type:complete